MSIVKLNNKAVSNATAFGSISSLGSMVFIKKLTASASATLSFVDGSDGVDFSTYKEYVFTFKNINSTGGSTSDFAFQGSTDGGSNYNVTITSTFFDAYHFEADIGAALRYLADRDLAQSTNFQPLSVNTSNNNADGGMSGTLTIYNPNSSVFVKHFMGNIETAASGDFSDNSFPAGYFNTTSALNAFQFKMNSGNIDAGDICLYGIA